MIVKHEIGVGDVQELLVGVADVDDVAEGVGVDELKDVTTED